MRVRAPTSCITLHLALHILSSTPSDSTNHRSCSTVFIEENLPVSGPAQFKSVLFKGQMYSHFIQFQKKTYPDSSTLKGILTTEKWTTELDELVFLFFPVRQLTKFNCYNKQHHQRTLFPITSDLFLITRHHWALQENLITKGLNSLDHRYKKFFFKKLIYLF